MRTLWIRLVITMVACVAVSGCETTELYDGPELLDRIVVSGAFEAGASWRISLHEAYSLRDPYPTRGIPRPIRDAHVMVTAANGSEVNLAHTRDGIYTAAGAPVPGATYTLRITHPEWGTAEAVGSAPLAPRLRVSRFERIREGRIGDRPTTVYEADVEVSSVQPGYVMIEGFQHLPAYGQTAPSIWSGVAIEGDTQVLRGSFADMGPIWVGWGEYGRRYFMTPFAAGETRSTTLTVQVWRNPGSGNELRLRASTLSGELQRHLATLHFQEATGRDPFAEPVRIYTNVRGGHGVFAGYSTHELVMPVPR